MYGTDGTCIGARRIINIDAVFLNAPSLFLGCPLSCSRSSGLSCCGRGGGVRFGRMTCSVFVIAFFLLLIFRLFLRAGGLVKSIQVYHAGHLDAGFQLRSVQAERSFFFGGDFYRFGSRFAFSDSFFRCFLFDGNGFFGRLLDRCCGRRGNNFLDGFFWLFLFRFFFRSGRLRLFFCRLFLGSRFFWENKLFFRSRFFRLLLRMVQVNITCLDELKFGDRYFYLLYRLLLFRSGGRGDFFLDGRLGCKYAKVCFRHTVSKLFYEQSRLFITEPCIGVVHNHMTFLAQKISSRAEPYI
ncbi:hypothetical protein Barb7_01610 [Bacteroidales bacterium Barb7]|nr:hypothetical protein Barb7_01610 [Bacteroidales bacterium Barb7]